MLVEEKELIERLTKAEELGKSNKHRIKELEDDVCGIKEDNKVMHEMNTNIAVMLNEMKSMNEKVDTTNEKVDSTNQKVDGLQKEVTDIKLQPAKKWDKATWLIVAGVLGYALNYFLNMIPK